MRQTSFRTITGGVISGKRVSLASHAPVALVAPKLLRLGKSQVTIVGILPNKRSHLARYCLVWGIRLVYCPATVGQVTIKAYFTSCGSVHHLIVFFSFMFRYDMQVPS